MNWEPHPESAHRPLPGCNSRSTLTDLDNGQRTAHSAQRQPTDNGQRTRTMTAAGLGPLVTRHSQLGVTPSHDPRRCPLPLSAADELGVTPSHHVRCSLSAVGCTTFSVKFFGPLVCAVRWCPLVSAVSVTVFRTIFSAPKFGAETGGAEKYPIPISGI